MSLQKVGALFMDALPRPQEMHIVTADETKVIRAVWRKDVITHRSQYQLEWRSTTEGCWYPLSWHADFESALAALVRVAVNHDVLEKPVATAEGLLAAINSLPEDMRQDIIKCLKEIHSERLRSNEASVPSAED